jgi:hypothetical protein
MLIHQGVHMKSLILSILVCGNVFATTLLDIDPYSIHQVEENFPFAITESHSIPTQKNFTGKLPAQVVVKKEVDYAKLVPELIKLVQEQQRELNQLKKDRSLLKRTLNN